MDKRLKILHANTGLVAGGAERLITDMALSLSKKDCTVEVMLLEDKGNNIFEKELVEGKVKIDILKYNNKFDFRNLFLIRRKIKNFDVVHVHIFPMLYWVALATIGLKNKPILIATEHNTYNRRRNYKFLWILEKFIYSLYDKIISITPETETELLNWIKEKPSGRFETILNGIDIKKFKNAKGISLSNLLVKDVNISDRFLIMVARFDEQKDHETLLNSLTLLDDSVKLILVGEGVLKNHYQNRVKELNISDRVFFIGRRRDVPEIVKSANISIISSNWEGFGLVAIEAMAAGIPVLASKVPGLDNVVKGAGILFEKGNYVELAENISKMLEDQSLAEKYSILGMKRANQYDIDIMVNKYKSVYNDLLKRKHKLRR
ncbi:glycosyltransferase [Bacillus sp. JJ1122]|uniref:glycosyltransferase n=1 Tax=Bacillus sp. JJ1122 TaxID=3122951 RepID=UPI002FFE47AA